MPDASETNEAVNNHSDLLRSQAVRCLGCSTPYSLSLDFLPPLCQPFLGLDITVSRELPWPREFCWGSFSQSGCSSKFTLHGTKTGVQNFQRHYCQDCASIGTVLGCLLKFCTLGSSCTCFAHGPTGGSTEWKSLCLAFPVSESLASMVPLPECANERHLSEIRKREEQQKPSLTALDSSCSNIPHSWITFQNSLTWVLPAAENIGEIIPWNPHTWAFPKVTFLTFPSCTSIAL